MAPVHERAAALAVGDVVELGCCFGFLSLRLAAAGHRVTAVDLSPGTAGCWPRWPPRSGCRVRAVAGDALAVPLADRCADTVFAVHLLEHLPPGADAVVLAEMLRLARRRVVVAVPYEDEPNPTWGHLRTFDAAALTALGATTGHPFEVDRAPRRLAGHRPRRELGGFDVPGTSNPPRLGGSGRSGKEGVGFGSSAAPEQGELLQ